MATMAMEEMTTISKDSNLEMITPEETIVGGEADSDEKLVPPPPMFISFGTTRVALCRRIAIESLPFSNDLAHLSCCGSHCGC